MCLIFCFLAVFFSLLVSAPVISEERPLQKFIEEERNFGKTLEVWEKERKEALQRRVATPLDLVGQKLLTELLAKEGTLDEVLSSEPYLTYLKERVGKTYEDYAAYFTAMPTPRLKTNSLFAFKDALPPKQTTEELQAWIRYYFQIRKFYAIPDILNDKTRYMAHLNKPYLELSMVLVKPPTTKSEEKRARAKLGEVLRIRRVPHTMARVETQVYHKAWRKLLETHGSRDGLLRCAITTPDDFALTRSFFQNTEALEKWILEPLKSSKPKKKGR